VKGGLLLDVVVRESPPILKLFAGEDQPLLIRGNTLLVLDLGFDVFDGIAWLNLESDSLASESFDKNLHTSSQPEDEVKRRLFLDVVVRQGSSIFQLFAGKDQPLLIGRDSLFVLDLGLDIFDGVAGLDLEGDGFPREGFDEDLHSASQSQDEMKRRLLLDVVVGQRASVFQLFPGEDESLLIRGNAFFVLDLGLDVFDAVGRFDFEGNRLPRKSLHEDLHDEMWALIKR